MHERPADERSDVRINGGFFVMRRDVLDWIEPGEEFVEEPFEKLIAARRAVGVFVHDGFWGPMDTIKDKQWLEGLLESGRAPWLTVGVGAPTAPSRDATARLGRAGAGSQRARDRRALRRHRDRLRRDDALAGPVLARGSRSIGSSSRRTGERVDEARASAEAFLAGLREPTVEILVASATASCRTTAAEVKDMFEALKARVDPDSCSPTRATTSIRTIASCAS